MGRNSGSGSDDDEYPYFRTVAAVHKDNKDNKDEFVRLFNCLYPDDQEEIVLTICNYDAVNCLAAILDGEAGDENTISHYISDINHNIPLHKAARRSTPRIAKLLLEKGFSADLRPDTNIQSRYSYLKDALPLNVSLHFARFHLWNDHRFKSPTHQIIHLCEWTEHILTNRVIARKTTEIKHEFFKYLKQGKVVEVGALLTIASDLIMSSSSTIDGESSGSIGFKNIMEMRQFLLAEMSRSLGASNTQLKEMKKTLRLLEIFDRIGDKLVAHMPMWDDCCAAAINGSILLETEQGIKISSLIKDAAYDEEEIVEYDHDAVPSTYYTHSDGQYSNFARNFSTKVHFPSWLEKGSSHVDVPLSLPTTVTKRVVLKKHASFTGAFVAKAVRHLRYR